MLRQASELRQQWRTAQGAITFSMHESSIKVDDPRLADPRVTVQRINTYDSPSRSLVAEMMILAGQAAATFGEPGFCIARGKMETMPSAMMPWCF